MDRTYESEEQSDPRMTTAVGGKIARDIKDPRPKVPGCLPLVTVEGQIAPAAMK